LIRDEQAWRTPVVSRRKAFIGSKSWFALIAQTISQAHCLEQSRKRTFSVKDTNPRRAGEEIDRCGIYRFLFFCLQLSASNNQITGRKNGVNK
jgi:hypothetical protein